jgi:hypothetical protein
MAVIPHKKFYKLSKHEQEQYAVNKMIEAYEAADQWKKLAQQSRKRHIPDPEINRPDEAILKSE